MIYLPARARAMCIVCTFIQRVMHQTHTRAYNTRIPIEFVILLCSMRRVHNNTNNVPTMYRTRFARANSHGTASRPFTQRTRIIIICQPEIVCVFLRKRLYFNATRKHANTAYIISYVILYCVHALITNIILYYSSKRIA